MENRNVLNQIIVGTLVIGGGVFLRLIPHPANVAPIGAMALFGGMYLNKKYALLIPAVTLFLSDIILGFYRGMPFVYASFLLIGIIGLWMQSQKKSWKNLIFVTLISSFLFFIITNFGVWLLSGMYERNIPGFFRCYVLALPFLRNSIFGDLGYFGIFIACYQAVTHMFVKMRPVKLP